MVLLETVLKKKVLEKKTGKFIFSEHIWTVLGSGGSFQAAMVVKGVGLLGSSQQRLMVLVGIDCS